MPQIVNRAGVTDDAEGASGGGEPTPAPATSEVIETKAAEEKPEEPITEK